MKIEHIKGNSVPPSVTVFACTYCKHPQSLTLSYGTLSNTWVSKLQDLESFYPNQPFLWCTDNFNRTQQYIIVLVSWFSFSKRLVENHNLVQKRQCAFMIKLKIEIELAIVFCHFPNDPYLSESWNWCLLLLLVSDFSSSGKTSLICRNAL